uniref:3-ketoacyl-CoA synthase 11-like n=1 Tax=Erigeron canadensis TaxID=72917 RepID=UPI001CB93FA9|nr:3-ketoacyl-CoA synthase 11-like [Erigeron canadensis]
MSIINFTLKALLEYDLHSYFSPEANVALLTLLVFVLALSFYMTRRTPCKVYLIDFACYKPPDTQKCTKEFMIRKAEHSGYFSKEMLDFIKKVFDKSGLGDSTYLSEIYLKDVKVPNMKEARREMEMSVFGSIDILLAKTGVRCEDIGILIVNCCIYNTMPSLSSMIVNRYKLKDNIISYNIVGMGCSAGLMAIGLAEQLLQVHHDCYALVMSTESITENCYVGDDRSKFLTNCLFRVGGAAILLSNRKSDRRNCKYEHLHTVLTNQSYSDQSYNCIIQEEDTAGRTGITVTKHLFKAASAVVTSNVTTLGKLILPVQEKLRYITNNLTQKLLPTEKVKPYIPNYAVAVDHFLPHVGGKPVLDELQKNLRFGENVMEASRMTLYRFGNTSSSSIWYELAYAEAKGRVKKGDRVWQMAFGSGFKCCSTVWRARRAVGYDEMNPWSAEIDEFPVHVDYDDGPLPVFFEPTK